MTDLKACPFCPSTAVTIVASVAFCDRCGASVEMGNWNSRPTEDRLRAALEKIAELSEYAEKPGSTTNIATHASHTRMIATEALK